MKNHTDCDDMSRLFANLNVNNNNNNILRSKRSINDDNNKSSKKQCVMYDFLIDDFPLLSEKEVDELSDFIIEFDNNCDNSDTEENNNKENNDSFNKIVMIFSDDFE